MEQMTLFDQVVSQPLAARLRPRDLDEFVGQTHLLGKGKVLRRLIESDQVSSMIFWGPPGVGKSHPGKKSLRAVPGLPLSTFPLSPAGLRRSGP